MLPPRVEPPFVWLVFPFAKEMNLARKLAAQPREPRVRLSLHRPNAPEATKTTSSSC